MAANQYGIDLGQIIGTRNALIGAQQQQQLNALQIQSGQRTQDYQNALSTAPDDATRLKTMQQFDPEKALQYAGQLTAQQRATHDYQVDQTTKTLGALTDPSMPDEALLPATNAALAKLKADGIEGADQLAQIAASAGNDPVKLRAVLKQQAQAGLEYKDQLAEQDKAATRATAKQQADTAAAAQTEIARHNVEAEKTAAQQAATAASALNKPVVLQPGAQLVRPQTGEVVGGQAPAEQAPGLTGHAEIDATVPGYATKPVGSTGRTQAAIDMQALNNLTAGTKEPVGRTGLAGIISSAVTNRMAEMDPSGDLAANKTQLKALSSALSDQVTKGANVERSVAAAEKGFQQVVTTFQGKVNDATMPLANAIANAAKYQFSPGEVSSFKAGLQEVANEYQQVFARSGQVTDTVRATSAKIADGNLSITDLGKVLTELQAQGGIVSKEYKNEAAKIQAQINGIAQPKTIKSAATSGWSNFRAAP